MDIKKTTCPYCGEEIEVGARKCRYCGEWLIEHKESVERQAEDAHSAKEPKWNIIIPVVCLVIGLCAMAYWYYDQVYCDPFRSYDLENVDSLDSDDDASDSSEDYYPSDNEDDATSFE